MAYKKSTHLYRKSKPVYRNHYQKIIFCVIILVFLIIIITTILALVFTPEKITKDKISNLSSKYYENFFYQGIENADTKIIQKYEEYGSAIISLRQLIFYDQTLSQSDIDYLKNYCDENATHVKFYPEPPYSKTSYHTEYHYSCEF